MGKIVEKKKKKKGRPSLLDLQKRNLKEQQQQQQIEQKQQQKRNPNSAPHSNDNHRSAPVRRSTRRNPNPGGESPEKEEEEDDDDDEEELAGKRREKKLKLVLRLPPNQKSSLNSASLNSGGSDSNADEDNAASNGNKKRKINAIGDGSGAGQQDSQKGDKSISGTNPSNPFQGTTKLDSGPSTPLPDKKLLLFILDRLQKKDTYGVFSDPVDPEELPDYHEVIEHPMDFSTVRKKLTGGAYANLEQFEKDVFLICTNAMQYNAPDTIYFRQARSIHELAKKNFENLRQESDDNEPEPKVVRRGRPPTKNLKKPVGRPSLERASEFSSDATLATEGENATLLNHDMRKGSLILDKSGLADSAGRLNGSRNNDVYASWLADNKFERNEEFTGSVGRGSFKLGKKQFALDENRRSTYFQSRQSVTGREPSVLTTFEGERKQLMPIGVLVEHGYARSLARFAANLGPVAWRIAAKKIERSLPSCVKFGPGWVGENDVAQNRTLLFPLQPLGQTSVSHPVSALANSSVTTSYAADSMAEKLSVKAEGDDLSDKNVPSATAATSTTTTATTISDGHPSKSLSLTASTSSAPALANRSPEPVTAKAEPIEGFKSHAGFNILNSSSIGGVRPRSPFPIQGPIIHPGMNGFNGFNLTAHMGKLTGASRPASFNIQLPQIPNRTNNNVIHPATANNKNSEGSKFSENQSTINPGSTLPNSGNEALAPASASASAPSMPGFHPRPSWQGLSPQRRPDTGTSPQQKPDSVPPDLNVRFQSPGSPNSSRVDSTQPDLALQL